MISGTFVPYLLVNPLLPLTKTLLFLVKTFRSVPLSPKNIIIVLSSILLFFNALIIFPTVESI